MGLGNDTAFSFSKDLEDPFVINKQGLNSGWALSNVLIRNGSQPGGVNGEKSPLL